MTTHSDHKDANRGGEIPSRSILGMRVDATSYLHAAGWVVERAARADSGYVCVATVHMVMEAWDDPSFREVVNRAGLVTPDGMPLVWGLRRLGLVDAERVYGPDLTPRVCAAAARKGIPVGFLGGSPEALARMQATLQRRVPNLEIAYACSPPFGGWSEVEDDRIVREICTSGARILFVGLGCPRQERWMADHQGSVPAVMVGVGAAFDFLAGIKSQAPAWMQGAGLEWLFRLATEPRRLWWRYLRHNPRFVYWFARQLMGKLTPKGGSAG